MHKCSPGAPLRYGIYFGILYFTTQHHHNQYRINCGHQNITGTVNIDIKATDIWTLTCFLGSLVLQTLCWPQQQSHIAKQTCLVLSFQGTPTWSIFVSLPHLPRNIVATLEFQTLKTPTFQWTGPTGRQNPTNIQTVTFLSCCKHAWPLLDQSGNLQFSQFKYTPSILQHISQDHSKFGVRGNGMPLTSPKLKRRSTFRCFCFGTFRDCP